MADTSELKTIQIKDLQEVTSASDTDFLAVDNGGVTQKISVKNYNATANGTAQGYAEAAEKSAQQAAASVDSVKNTVTEINNNLTSAQSAANQAEQAAETAEAATTNLQTYVNSAKESADAAAVSEQNTKEIASGISDYSKAAQSYAVGGTDYRSGEDVDNARFYYGGSKTAEANASTSEKNASASEGNAATSEKNAADSATAAATSETNAGKSADAASTSAQTATQQAQAATLSATNADTSATKAESYAVGGTGSRDGEDADNAKHYAEEARKSAELASGSVAGVASFNGRTGMVVPEAGDYAASDIHYVNTTSGLTAEDTQAAIDEIAKSDAEKATKTDVNTALDKKADQTAVDDALAKKQDDLGIKAVGGNLSLSADGVLDAKAQEITVDSELSDTSTNPVQNSTVKAAIDDLAEKTHANYATATWGELLNKFATWGNIYHPETT